MTASPEVSPTGTIYDIGYRRYTGQRLGRRGAVSAMLWAGLRAAFGMGRSGRSKILPWGALIFALLPAGIAVAIRVLAGDLLEIYSYQNYLWGIGALFFIFVAAQAPELVITDIRHHVLPLYFSRPISRFDYVASKLSALAIALLGLTLLPVLLLFLGRVLAAEDVVGALGEEIGALPGILVTGALHAVTLASLGLAIASLAARRAFAAGAVLAVYLVGGAVSSIFSGPESPFPDVAPFLSPLAILDGVRQWLFGGPIPDSPVAAANVPMWTYGVATAALMAISWAILALRYRRLAA